MGVTGESFHHRRKSRLTTKTAGQDNRGRCCRRVDVVNGHPPAFSPRSAAPRAGCRRGRAAGACSAPCARTRAARFPLRDVARAAAPSPRCWALGSAGTPPPCRRAGPPRPPAGPARVIT
eukprot:6082253-Pyramimonas_sp.AAC.1